MLKLNTMKKIIIPVISLILLVILTLTSQGQVGINTTGSQPDPSAGLDVNFTNKGFLPPRMTYDQRKALVNPVDGLLVYCTNCNPDGSGVLSMYQAGVWKNLDFSCAVPQTPAAGTYIPGVHSIAWNWGSVPIADGYKGNKDNDYSTADDLGSLTAITETGLHCQTSYTRYIWAYNACGHSAAPLEMTQTTTDTTVTAPAASAATVAPCLVT